MNLRHIQIGSIVGAVVRFLSAVDQDPALGSGEEECRPPYLPAAAEHGHPDPCVLAGDIAVDTPPDGPEKLFPVLIHRSQELPDLFYR
ncbi:MAG: hypothetical protein BWY93_02178 [Euryarchaeota archaeon ADurb.BinA087]|nr:MAG: hypothetical protein BWY93_02178 [Euryarchaeota archaeon ADurb.BinA087]